MRNCQAFFKYQRQELADQNSDERNDRQGKAGTYIVRSSQEINNQWPYSFAAPCVTARALSSTLKRETIIDSGATEHFSGQRSELMNFIRWREPKTVIVADGKEVLCEGTGTIVLEAYGKSLALNEVWYVPEFKNVQLISVFRLNDDGIEVQFTEHRCILKKNGTTLVTMIVINGLYKVPEPNTPSSLAYTGKTNVQDFSPLISHKP
ncbi:hypothetical protein K3495_g12787 [Podosphaera aphanis]|nr:hypothetical protein K3495_g12787 [Podosphaera aphanis]